MAKAKPTVDPKTALITTAAVAGVIALFTFLPATKPVVLAACTTLIEQDGSSVIPPEAVSDTTVE